VSTDYAVFTVCNLAYLPKALVLAESLSRHDQAKLRVYLIDRKVDVDLLSDMADFEWIEDVGVPGLNHLAFKYDITEFSTSLKPWLSMRLLERFRKVIFLDPDTCLYHSVAPILRDLDEHTVILTPHYTTPQSDTFPDSDVAMLRFGSFNLGFFAVRQSAQAGRFLTWWSDRCFRLGYFETQFGLSTDQKWVSIAPCFFPDLHISFNLGYNVAFWNIQERAITKVGDRAYSVNGEFPLIFFHFSSFDETRPELLTKRPFREQNRADLLELSTTYKMALQKYKIAASAIKYGFDYMANGDYISPTLRRAYACIAAELPENHDPFDSSGPVGNFAIRNHLLEESNDRYTPSGYNDIAQHKTKFWFVNLAMRIILRMIGPNRFANFSRLLVYLSSYRQNRGLWKL
jgi:hypothetical protein